jgi:hypothetical protein
MKGTRVYPNVDGFLDSQAINQPGAYGRCTAYDARYPGHGVTWWQVTAPNGGSCTLGPNFQIAEHEDGTITVSPSIEIDTSKGFGAGPKFHGYLRRGEWSVA